MANNHPTTSTAVENSGTISATSLAIIGSPADTGATSASGALASQPTPSPSSVQPVQTKQEQPSGGETHSTQPISCSFAGEVGTPSIAGSGAQSTTLNSTMHDLTPSATADTAAMGSVFRCLFPNCLYLSATSQAAREHIRTVHLHFVLSRLQADIATGHALEQYFEEIPRIAPAATTVFTHLSGLPRHISPSPSSTTATPSPTMTLSDAMAAIQPVSVPGSPSAAAAAAGLATPPPTAQFYQVPQAGVRHPHWQSPTWPAGTGMNCSPTPPTPGSSPYLYQQAAMATLPGTTASFDGLPNQRLVDPTAAHALATGALPTTVYGMPAARIARRDIRADGTAIPRPRGDGRKCRKVYGMDNKDKWCTQCKWKKACVRFTD